MDLSQEPLSNGIDARSGIFTPRCPVEIPTPGLESRVQHYCGSSFAEQFAGVQYAKGVLLTGG